MVYPRREDVCQLLERRQYPLFRSTTSRQGRDLISEKAVNRPDVWNVFVWIAVRSILI
jgi:hypothetical protein